MHRKAAMADVAGGGATAMDDSEDERPGGGGRPTEKLAAPEGGDEQLEEMPNAGSLAGCAGTDRSDGQFATGARTTSSASVFPMKFSSFPASFAPAPLPRGVPSLFPSSGNVGSKQKSDDVPSWLSNSSFSENLLPPPLSFSASKVTEHLRGKDVLDEIEKREGEGTERKKARFEPGTESASSTSDSDISRGNEGEKSRHKRLKEKRRRKRKKQEEERKRRKERKQTGDELKIGSLEGQSIDRKAAVKAWSDGKANTTKEYFVDTRGDRDNLAFGSLYRMDVARYVRQQIDGGVREGTKKRNATHLDVPEADGDVQENKSYRYWSGQAMALETRRDFRRIRIHPLRPSISTTNNDQKLDIFIPLGSKEKRGDRGEEEEEEGESWNDYIIRRTREFNTLTRERPDDENSWLEFAKFQDGLVHMAQRKGVKQQAVEKKISVLEKALEHHPDSLQLTLIYLEACSLRDTVPEVLAKWEKAVVLLSGSYRFWKEFLLFICSQFSLFSVATVRAMYIRALGALTAARDRLRNGDEKDTALRNAELAMVAILADRCRFELQTGHAEFGLGILQAAIEYSLFPPLIQTSENNKRRLFEAFWDSQASRIGEEGAVGWALWLEMDEEQFQRAQAHEAEQEEQAPGGWTGWSAPVVLSSDPNEIDRQGNAGKDGGESSSEEGDEVEEEGAESDEDEATLLAKLGLSSMDAGKELEVTNPGVWLRWAAEERKRDSEQWLPIHARLEVDEVQDEQLERVVMFEDIRNTLVSLSSEEALHGLIGHFFEFCNLPHSNWCSSNDFSLQQGIDGLESLTGPLSRLRGIRVVGSNISQYVVGNRENQEVSPGENVLKSLVGDPEWFLHSLDRAQFVCNALLLLQSSSFNSLARRHWDLTETLLVVQCLASDNGVKASRNLAKKLLKTHRQDIALWTAYALVEGAAGHIDTARKVFDTTLASLPALPNELQDDAPLLYLACADMEMLHGSKTRALYILCHFGAGMPYAPSPSNVEDPISPTLILKAKLGFQQHLQNVRRGRTYIRDTASFSSRPIFGVVLDERGVAVIACVGLFEELSSGWEAAVSVFEESLAFTLPGKWKESKECEALMERFVGLLRRSMPSAKPSQVCRSAMRGLTEYPHNSVLLEMLVQSSPLTYNLRRYFDDSVKRCPSTLLWMFALATELGINKEGNAPRIRSLFERALEMKATQHSVLLWRAYLAYEYEINQNIESARRIYFRAIHACPWSKKLWLDGFAMLSSVLTAKQLAEFQEIMRDKELRIRTDVYEILLQDAGDDS